MLGGPGNDAILSGLGLDNPTGNSGNDYLTDGEFQGGATDTLSGGDGNDVLDPFNKPAKKDVLTCGSGFDRVLADRKDVVAPDCEKVAVGLAAARELDRQIRESGFYESLSDGLAPSPVGPILG